MQTTHISLCVTAQEVPEMDFTQNILTLNLRAPDVRGYMPWEDGRVKAVGSSAAAVSDETRTQHFVHMPGGWNSKDNTQREGKHNNKGHLTTKTHCDSTHGQGTEITTGHYQFLCEHRTWQWAADANLLWTKCNVISQRTYLSSTAVKIIS